MPPKKNFQCLRPGIRFVLPALLGVILFFTAPTTTRAETIPPVPSPGEWILEATNQMGVWIWETNWFDKQTVRLWKDFELPAGKIIFRALIRLTVDNGYTLFLDGEEIGRGSDWRTVTEYDVTKLLGAGRHRIAVEGFNDRLEGGLIFSL